MKTIYAKPYVGMIKQLREARQRLHMTQVQVGRRLGVSRHWIAKIERCEVRLDVLQMIRVCRVYGIFAASLVKAVEDELSDEDGFSYLSDSAIASCLPMQVLILARREPLAYTCALLYRSHLVIYSTVLEGYSSAWGCYHRGGV